MTHVVLFGSEFPVLWVPHEVLSGTINRTGWALFDREKKQGLIEREGGVPIGRAVARAYSKRTPYRKTAISCFNRSFSPGQIDRNSTPKRW